MANGQPLTPKSYCDYVQTLPPESLHRIYHDTQYGFPIESDNELFERLILEINQAGLSWTTILNKQENFRKAYRNFDIKRVAKFTEKDRARLMNDAGIIRNRLKINAAIHNAQIILNLQKENGSFKKWLDSNHPKTLSEWGKLFKKTFVFTGGEIVKEFLMSTGYLEGAHRKDCPIYEISLSANPNWKKSIEKGKELLG
ncbi:MAG: DNA-3-methyladenine glycosylase I [Chloroherpetonaceae bacterium]|nr:DNA-3-methyladenine glycosylase I [Chloroherpetonaceae bacterium]